MELVSIIVPVYNVEKYLEECVSSLMVQTYHKIEIILIDDGSKDESGIKCNKLAEKDRRIKVIHKENQGLGFARNTGLDNAEGKYVVFVDADDYVEKDMIQILIEGVVNNNADTCIGGYRRVGEGGNILFEEHYNDKLIKGDAVYNEFFVRMLGSAPDKHDSIRMSVWNVLYSADLIRKHKIRFPSERIFISEDIIWNSDYYRYAKAVKMLPTASYNYRVSSGSLTVQYKPDKFEMICELYNEMERRLEDSFQDPLVIHRLQRQFFINLTSCFRQEKNKSYDNNFFKIYKRIKYMNNHRTVIRIVRKYPINKMQFKARIFLVLVKYKASVLLALLTEYKVI